MALDQTIGCARLLIPYSQFIGECHHRASAGIQLQIGWITSRIAPVVTGKNQHKVRRTAVVAVDQDDLGNRIEQTQRLFEERKPDHVPRMERRTALSHARLLSARGREARLEQRLDDPCRRG